MIWHPIETADKTKLLWLKGDGWKHRAEWRHIRHDDGRTWEWCWVRVTDGTKLVDPTHWSTAPEGE